MNINELSAFIKASDCGEDACYLWNSYLNHNGTPIYQSELVRPALWEAIYKQKPMGWVNTICGNRICVRPSHFISRNIYTNSQCVDEINNFLMNFVKKTDNCWIWTGCVKRRATFIHNDTIRSVLKFLYEYNMKIELKGHYDLYTKCRNLSCVNPDHVIVTIRPKSKKGKKKIWD